MVFEPAGPGRYVYDVMLSGVLSADQLQNTTQAWHVTRSYAPRHVNCRAAPFRADLATSGIRRKRLRIH